MPSRRLVDVTRSLGPGHPTWPGDEPFTLRQVASMSGGDLVNVMRLETTTHVGTHLDAPYHYDDGGERLQDVDLGALVGPCLVLDAPGEGAVGAEGVVETLRRVMRDEPPPARVLLRTGEPDAWTVFPDGFRGLTVELVDALADLGVRLVGTDAPSVDAFGTTDASGSPALPVHAAFARRGLLIVEGLALAAVTPGAFELICLPLRLHGADASPVRALLRTLD